jgi:hypothetical protein
MLQVLQALAATHPAVAAAEVRKVHGRFTAHPELCERVLAACAAADGGAAGG